MDTITTFADETVQSLIELGRQTSGPQTVPGGNIPFVYGEDGQIVSLESYVYNDRNARPGRVKQSVTVLDPASFVAYHKLFADEGTRVFADEPGRKVLAVLDYHEASAEAVRPRWGSHRVTLHVRESEEWKVWAGMNNKPMTQQGFAEFLEQNAMDITSQSTAAIIEMARDLEATTETDFASGLRMANGQTKLRWTETVKARVGSSEVTLPDQFGIGIPVFVGGAAQPVNCLLRFRVKDGKLTFWYTMVRPESVLRTAFLAARDEIASELGVQVLNGSPA